MFVRICLVLVFWLLVVPISGLPAQQPAAPAESRPGRAEFDRLFGQWKDLLAELAVLRNEYRTADEQQRAEIKKKWGELIQKGDTMAPQLLGAAEKAYAQSPNADKQVTDLLMDVLIGHVKTDNYEEALRLGKLLAENQCPDKRVYNAAGVAAFATGDFELAEKYLKLARQNVIGDTGKAFLENIPHYKEACAKEKKIRAAEATADDLPRVLLKTSKGDIEVELFENEAPIAVANFISLVEKGFYNGLLFHRVLPGFMAQVGCPKGDGTGGPGYNIPCECHRPNHRLHFRGSLSMAHAGRDTGGSQFFLTFLPTAHLDGKHTVFGRVIKGFDVLHKFQRRDPSKPGAPKPDKIVKATVLRKRPHEYAPKKVGDEFNK